MICKDCDKEMLDMGPWPNMNEKDDKGRYRLTNKYHCLNCKEYVTVNVEPPTYTKVEEG